MEKIDSENVEIQRLFDFCRKHDNIYIYGAGIIGKRYFEILQSEQILVKGFVTTRKEKDDFCGVNVYDVNELRHILTEADGIIPAYSNSTVVDVTKKFIPLWIDVLEFEHDLVKKVIQWKQWERSLLAMKEELKKFEPPEPIDRIWDAQSILITRLDAIGDVICTTALIREVRRNFPQSSISVVIRRQNESLLRNCPYIDELILYDTGYEEVRWDLPEFDFEAYRQKVWKFVMENYPSDGFDLVIQAKELLCGRNGVQEMLLAFYSGARCRVGRIIDDKSDYRAVIYRVLGDLYSSFSMQESVYHETMYQLDMLRECGLKVRDNRLELWPGMRDQEVVEKLWQQNHLGSSDCVIAVALVGSLPSKTWSPLNHIKLMKIFYEQYGDRVKFLLMGGPDAKEAAAVVIENTNNAIDATDAYSLSETAAAMQRCTMYLGSNTGLLHMASAFGKPAVTIYAYLADGNTRDGNAPVRWEALGSVNIALIPSEGLDGCHGHCNKNYSHCINQIKVEQVQMAVECMMGRLGILMEND